MIKKFQFYINESFFSKSFNERLSFIENLIEKSDDIHDNLIEDWNNYELNFKNNKQKIYEKYLFFFKIRNRILYKFINILDDKKLDQEKIDLLIEKWEDFERTISYGQYDTTNKLSIYYSEQFILLSNNFLKKIEELKKEFIIDLNTKDIFILVKCGGNYITPCRKSFNNIRELKIKNRYYNFDSFNNDF